jgi:protein SCO1
MRIAHHLWLPALSVAMIVAGCSKSDAPKAKTYDIRGTVVAVDTNKPAVKLDHEDIPGFMKAMVMEFPVADAKALEGMKPGDKVKGKLNVESGKYTIIQLQK